VSVLLSLAHDHEPHVYPVVFAAFQTGARRGELLALRWEDIDFSARQIQIRRALVRGALKPPKSGQARRIAMAQDLAARLDVLAETRHHREGITDPEWVFQAPMGGLWDEHNFARAWRRLRSKAAKNEELKVRPLPFHCARHTFASLALEAGRSIKWLADALGHADPAVTLRTYAHAMPAADEDLDFITNLDRTQTARKRTQSIRLSKPNSTTI
jgi:integrase